MDEIEFAEKLFAEFASRHSLVFEKLVDDLVDFHPRFFS